MTDVPPPIGRADLGQPIPDDLEPLVRIAVGWMHRRLRTSGPTHGLGYASVSLVNRLRIAGPQTLRELSAWEGTSEPVVGQMTSRLIEGGYVERVGHTAAVVLRATPRGVAAAEGWVEGSLEWLRSATGELPDADRVALRRAAEILVDLARR